MEVHTVMGAGFLEAVYRTAIALEFGDRDISFVAEPSFPVVYKTRPTALRYRADFVCFNEVVVEIKAVRTLTGIEESRR